MSARGALSLLCLLLSLPALGGQTSFTNSGGQLNVGWQDREGKAQQLSYRLEAGKLPLSSLTVRPGCRKTYCKACCNRPLAFPEVQFSLVRPAMSLSIKSRNANKAREASQWVKPEQAKLEAAWLTQHYFQPFTAPTALPPSSRIMCASPWRAGTNWPR